METGSLGMRMFGIGRAIQAFDGPDSDGPDFDGPDSDMEPLQRCRWTFSHKETS